MPRPLALGNGRLLVQIDDRGRIRDFFWPEVGIRNHVGGHFFHTGIYENGKFSWLEWDEWEVQQEFDPNRQVGKTVHQSSSFGLSISCRDQVVGDSFLRNLEIVNLTDRPRELEIFFSQDFRVAESDIGDTAFYHPGLDAIIHYKWNYCFVCMGRSGAAGIRQKTVGIRGVHGLQGTWRDAEDGSLHEKPIEQGAVDSTFSVGVSCPSKGSSECRYEIACLSKVPSLGFRLTQSSAEQAASPYRQFDRLPAAVREVADQSIPIMLSQIASNGAILAANDSDIMKSNRSNYSYVWPRDGALVAEVLDRLRMHEVAARYHRFAFSLISEDQPFFLQKYCADGSLGATWHPWSIQGKVEVPLQEDETALSLWSLMRHIELSGDVTLLDEFYDQAILPMGRFLCEFLDENTCLPHPSYDLWEERRGVHSFTVATVVAGLNASAKLAAMRGDPEENKFLGTAAAVKEALLSHLVDRQHGRLVRSAHEMGLDMKLDHTADASLLLVRRFADMEASDPRVQATRAHLERTLWVHSPVGGMARYSGDYYARISEAWPGNPWLITTMWLAQEKIQSAPDRSQLHEALRLLEWAAERAETTGVLGEQFHPDSGETLTVSPLTWSHSEYLATCLDWLAKEAEIPD